MASVPTGATTGDVVVSATGGYSVGGLFTVLPTPTIVNLLPRAGAVGASVTIFGTNLGATQGSSTVTFNGTTATAIGSWTATQIVAAVPTGATTGNVVVNAAGVSSTGISFTVQSGSFISTTGLMNSGRDNGTATRLMDGTVLITGGVGASGILNSAEVYTQATPILCPNGSDERRSMDADGDTIERRHSARRRRV